MSSYFNLNRALQSAVASYLLQNLDTYAEGVAASLPVLSGADFDDLGKDHALVYVPEISEDPPFSGTYEAQLMIRVATLRDTSEATHELYCKAVFDLLCDEDLPTIINTAETNQVRVNQFVEGKSFSAGIVNDSMRHDTMELRLRVYQAPAS